MRLWLRLRRLAHRILLCPRRWLVQQRLAYAYLVKGDRDQAVKAFTGILEIPGALNKDHVLFELAKIEESQSRPEGALAHYQDLMKNYPNSPFTSEAAVRVKVLEVKKSPESPAAAPAPAASAPTPQPEQPAKSSSGKSAASSSKKKP